MEEQLLEEALQLMLAGEQEDDVILSEVLAIVQKVLA
jgi:hypothetical protein